MNQLFENNPVQLAAIMKNISDMIIVVEVKPGPDFFYIHLNKRAREVYGLTTGMIGKRIVDVYDPETGMFINQHYKRVIETDEPVKFELHLGTEWTGEILLNPIKNVQGEITHIISITRDVTERKELQEILMQKTTELELVWNHTSDAIFIMRENGSIYRVNPAFEDMIGYKEDEIKDLLIPPMFPGHNQQKHEDFLRRLYGGEDFSNIERKRVRKDGGIIKVLASYRPIKINQEPHAIVMYKDITLLKEVEAQLKEREEQFKSLFDHNPDVIWSTDIHGVVTAVNGAVKEILGYTEQEMLSEPRMLVQEWKEQQVQAYKSYVQKTIGGKSQEFEVTVRHKNGSLVNLKMKTLPIKVNDTIIGIYEVGQDVTVQNRAQKMLKKMAFSDSLTGLPNRRFINEEIDRCLEEARSRECMLALLYIDMDHFKEINDSMGHDVGDELLKQFAIKIKSLLKDNQMIARLGGDEFLVLLPDIIHTEEAVRLSQTIIQSLKKTWHIEGHEFSTTSSIGISIYPLHGTSKRQLLKQADEALYKAKNEGKNTFRIYE